MYESPISLVDNITDDIIEQLMLGIKKSVEYDIDKEELVKALQYDRGQYEKGYADGAMSATKTGHWIIIDDCEKFIAKCSECGRIEDSRMIHKYPYCHCGTKMQAESEEA